MLGTDSNGKEVAVILSIEGAETTLKAFIQALDWLKRNRGE
jgi:hypothetical protein